MTDPNLALNEIADRFWDGVLEREPIYATILGDERYDDRLPDLGEAGRAAEAAAYTAVAAEAGAIDPAGLDPEQVITRDMLLLVAETRLEAQRLRDYQLAVDHIFGVQTMPMRVAQYQRADTPERVERLLTRFAAYPTAVAQHIETLREGIADGRTAPSVPIRKAIDQMARMLAAPSEAFPAVTLARVETDADRERVRAGVVASVYPALQTLHDFLRDEYAAHARAELGVSGTPGGDELYRLAIRMQTTVATTPEEVHTFGLTDLEHIEVEKDTIARSLGHRDRHALRAALEADPADRVSSRAELVALAIGQVERAVAAAPRWFHRLPVAECVVLPVEEYREAEVPAAFYMPPALDGSRPGQYYINTYQPESRPLHNLASISFHEATPGHHFQLAIEQELTGLPRFRTLGARMVGVAYTEGWGLYCERLADEMGLYQNQAERFGMLNTQAWRAARLVVDSGIHALGWNREQAIAFMHERGSVPLLDAEVEVDRYTIWPGQALAYKIGQREIERARREVSELLGDRFDLRLFHDQVLAHGSLPLPTLRREIPGWVDAAVAGSATEARSGDG